jgi:dihydroorotate dehydrogenase
LSYIKEHFLDSRSLKGRKRAVPVVVKFSNDLYLFEVKGLMDQLFELGFDGVNFGNTAKNYDTFNDKIARKEKKLFDYFTHTFGGGLSGQPLRSQSLGLCREAVRYLKAGAPSQEFHVIRTGGISSAYDIKESEEVGVSLNQWFTRYFERFAENGHGLYGELYKDLRKI